MLSSHLFIRIPQTDASTRQLFRILTSMREYADRLIAASAKQDAFAAVLAEIAEKAAMKGKQGLSAKQVQGIADSFLGYSFKHKTKDAAIEAMRRRQLQDAIQASKERALSKLGV